jgi:hypothetical protein
MARCKRSVAIENAPLGSGGTATLTLGVDLAGFSLRVVDATGAPVAFTAARADDEDSVFHFRAGDAWDVDELKLANDVELKVVAAASSVAELITWSA